MDGEPRFVSDPPLIVPIEELLPGTSGDAIREQLGEMLATYRAIAASRSPPCSLESYRYVDLARKVVGVGSVGTRAWIVLLLGRDGEDPLLLQVKEATASVLEPLRRRRACSPTTASASSRPVADAVGQRHPPRLAARRPASTARQRDFYVRQLWDWKRSAEVETMRPGLLAVYGRAVRLDPRPRARPRRATASRSPPTSAGATAFDTRVASFAEAYADQNERDYAALAAAGQSGRIAVVEGL